MSRLLISNHGPYGAYELKATYQRNMLYGTLIMLLFVTLLIFGGWIYSVLSDDLVVIPPDTPPVKDVFIHIDLGDRQINVIPENPVGGGKKGFRKPSVLKGMIPNPVPMEDMSTENEGLLDTKDEIREFVIFNDLPEGDNNEGIGIGNGKAIGKVEDEILSKPTFIAREFDPVMISDSPPEYPPMAKTAGMEGDVWISAFVDKNGIVKKAIVAKSSGVNAGFDEAAVTSAYLCKYKPAKQNGFSIGVWVTYQVVFRLKEAY